MYLFIFFFVSVAFWTVTSICWQLFWLLAAQTLTVNGTSPFFYSFLLSREMLLNASQPFLPVGWGGGWGDIVSGGEDSDGGGGVWWGQTGATVEKSCRDGGVIRHVGKVWCVGLSYSLSAVCLAEKCVCLIVEGYSEGHTPDHQISLHPDIPALPQSQKTNTDSMNGGVYSSVCVFLRTRQKK